MREDNLFSEFLLTVGNGTLPVTVYGQGPEEISLIPLQGIIFITEITKLLDITFPLNIVNSSDLYAKRALLCVNNKNVDTVNLTILESLPGETVHLLSVNYVEDANADDFSLSPEALSKINAKGVPHLDLQLKVNAVCMIVRNLHFDDGLLNGTKVIIVDISPRVVTVWKRGNMELYSIPRITFQSPVEPGSPLTFCRRQFPLRLAYAMTINKSQGQTVDFVGVDLPIVKVMSSLTVNCMQHLAVCDLQTLL